MYMVRERMSVCLCVRFYVNFDALRIKLIKICLLADEWSRRTKRNANAFQYFLLLCSMFSFAVFIFFFFCLLFSFIFICLFECLDRRESYLQNHSCKNGFSDFIIVTFSYFGSFFISSLVQLMSVIFVVYNVELLWATVAPWVYL